MKLLAIDGNSIINRAFYGIKLLTTKSGQYTNGVYGFINILNRLMELESPDGVAVAFDLRKPTFRHLKYSQYKAGRKGMPDELASQMPILKEWLTLMGYKCIECEGYEADDILGTLAEIAERDPDNQCIIATGDRDSLQLISDNTRILLSATKMGKPEIINYDRAALFEKYGLSPDGMIELKALMGDSSDNIPGVAGIGEKTASDLIIRFQNIDYIYENIDIIDIKDGVRTKLKDGKDSAYLSRELGTICRTAPIDTDFSFYKKSAADINGVTGLMTKLEFFKLMEKMDLKPDLTAVIIDEAMPEEKYTVGETGNISLLKSADIYISGERYIIVSGKNIFEPDYSALKELLENKAIAKRVYDFKALCKEFPNAENVIFDLTLAAYLCNPSSSDYSLDRLANEYTVIPPQIENNDDEALKVAANFSKICGKMAGFLEESGQQDLLTTIEIPLARVLAQMEQTGFLADKAVLEKQSGDLASRISVIESKVFELTGYEFNLNSPKQLGIALFEKLELPAKKKTKSGYSTNAEVLEDLKDKHPAIPLILEYRQLSKLKSTYCDGLLNCIDNDGRIHSTFNQTEARTGRISSLEPNLQNIPVRTEEGKKLRLAFIAPDGYSLCDADYSQIELRVLASIADDASMIKAFNDEVDIHTITASQVFDMPIEMVTPLMRSRAKAVNFGIVYGIGAFSLSKDIGVTRAEADKYIKGYLQTYPQVSRYMTQVIGKAKEDGFVTTEFGRRRYLPELSSSNGMLRAFGERVARNAPIQGTAADIIKIAMVRVSERLKSENLDAKLILQVHDELIVECRDNIKETVCNILKEEMESAASLKVKLLVEAHSGKNWLEAK